MHVVHSWFKQNASVERHSLTEMAPKRGAGGAGNKSAQTYVADLWQQGLTETEARQQERHRKTEPVMAAFLAHGVMLRRRVARYVSGSRAMVIRAAAFPSC